MGLVAVCVGNLIHVLSFNFISDDAFIALRYVRNLIDGHGLVFNPGDRVEGFTSPLWIMLLAGLGYLGIDLLTAARFLGVLAGLVTMIVAYELVASIDDNNREASEWALLAPLIIAANGSFACWAASGLKTPLFTALVASSLLSVIRDRYWLSAF